MTRSGKTGRRMAPAPVRSWRVGRVLAAAGGAVALVVCLVFVPASTDRAAAAASPPLYSITDLGLIGGSSAFALNDNGDVVGSKVGGNGFRYHVGDPSLTDLGPGLPLGVADDGSVFGPGLGTSPGGKALAVAPSGRLAAGTAFQPGVIPPVYGSGTSMAGVWNATDGWTSLYPRGCEFPGLISAGAYGINDGGTLVGQGVLDDNGDVADGGSTGIAFRCAPDPYISGIYNATNLSLGGANSGAFAINEKGLIAGKTQVAGPNDVIQAVVWGRPGGPEPLGTAAEGHGSPSSQSAAFGLNDAGDVVGSYGSIATSPQLQVGSIGNRAFVWSEEKGMRDLTDLLPAGSGWTLNSAFDVNNRGQVVGQGTVDGQQRAFLLTLTGDVNVKADRVVVTQAIQNERNLDLLVEGKKTFAIVRVHSDTRDVPGVTGVLHGKRGAQDLGEIPPVSPPITVRRTPRPELTEQSLVFALPDAWVAEGGLTLQARVDAGVPETDYDDNATPPATVTFQRSTAVRMVVANIYYAGSPAPSVNSAAFQKMRRAFRQMLPTSDLLLSQQAFVTPVPEPTGTTSKCAAVLRLLETIRDDMDIDDNTLLYGLLPANADGSSPYGYVDAQGNARDPGLLGCAFLGSMVETGTTAEGAEFTAVHEFVHAVGRDHVPLCGATGQDAPNYPYPLELIWGGSLHQDVFPLSDGFDLGFDGTSFTPIGTAELMTYCRPRWVSDYTYENVYRLIPQIGASWWQRTFGSDVVNVVGTIDLLGASGDVGATYGPLDSTASVSEPGPYRIRFFNGSTQLSDTSFTPSSLTNEGFGTEAPVAIVNETVTMPAGADRLAIYDDRASKEISSMPITGVAPTVSVTAPAAGATLPASGTVTVSWSAHDDDGDPLRHTVLYRSAAGGPWSVLATGVQGSSLAVDAAGLAGAGDGAFRVVTSDGFFTGRGEVGGLKAPAKAPIVTIDSPLDGAIVTTEQAVLLDGAASGVGSGTLPDSAFSWSSDRDGPLGPGATLLAESLSVGTHEISLRVTTPEGKLGTASVTLVVRSAGLTPSKLAVSFDELGFRGTPSAPPAPQSLEIYDPSGGALDWVATSDNPAVQLSAPSGTTPSIVDVTVDTSGLLGGESLSAKVTVRRTDGTGDPLVVEVGARSPLEQAAVAPLDVDFGLQIQTASSSPHTVTFTNTGRGQVTLDAAKLAGSTPSDFAVSDDQCANATLSTGQSCTATVTFTPSSAGRRSAYLVFPGHGSPGIWFASLTGLGTKPPPPPAGGKLYGWGANGYGQTGSPRATVCGGGCVWLPTEVVGISDVVDVSAGYTSSVALTKDGHVWTWGQNLLGQLGLGTTDPTAGQHPTPQQVPGLADVVDVAAGYAHSLALLSNGTVLGWGQGVALSLCPGSGFTTTVPKLTCDSSGAVLTGVTAIAAGTSVCFCGTGSSFALKSNGTAVQWGSAGGSGGWWPDPVLAPGGAAPLTGIVAIAQNTALKADGTVWTWGQCTDGQSGDGQCPVKSTQAALMTATQVLKPDGSGPLTGIEAIAAFDRERYALTTTGEVLAWGSGKSDTFGTLDAGIALGIGTVGAESVNLPRPVLAPGGSGTLANVVELAAGLATLEDGTAVAWGRASSGGLGNGTISANPWPVRVKGVGGTGFLSGVGAPSGGATRFAIAAGGSGGPLSAGSPRTIAAEPGIPFNEVVATFDDSAPTVAASAYAVDIDWGDGTPPGSALVTGPPGGPFEIRAGHAYDRAGSYEPSIQVVGRSGDSITLESTVEVARAALAALPARDLAFVAGSMAQKALAGFTDSNPNAPESSFTATVGWGDGSAGGATVSGPPGGPFEIVAEHAYARAGTYPLSIHVTDRDGATLDLGGRALVAPAAFAAEAVFGTDSAAALAFTGPLARFRDANPLSQPTDYTAVVDWGDGTSSPGDLIGPPGGPYTVAGSHTYAVSQQFVATITVTGPADATAQARSTLFFVRQKLTVVASASPASGNVPLDSTFQYSVRNDGTQPYWLVTVDGAICGKATRSGTDANALLDPGETWTYTCSHTFATAGELTETGWAAGLGPLDAAGVRSDNVNTKVTVFSGWPFSGFFAPVDDPPAVNVVKAGSTVPVKFGLGANRGLDIFAPGFPASARIACTSGPTDALEEVANPGAASLTYDVTTNRYLLNWKTSAAWAGTCRRLVLRFRGGDEQTALFRFR